MLTSASSKELFNRFGIDSAFRIFHKVGLDAMDYPLDTSTPTVEALKNSPVFGLSEDEVVKKYSDIAEMAKRNDVLIGQTHSIFGKYEPSITQEFLEITRKDIIATAVLGAHHTVVHPIMFPGRIMDARREENFEFNLGFYRSLVPYLEKWNVKCAIENIWDRDENKVIRASECSDPQEILDYLGELGTDHFCACADTGHFALTAKDTGISVGDAIRKLGKAVEVVHIQAVDFVRDLHVVPFTVRDAMDWDDIISALREIGYKGTLNFEVMAFVKQFPMELSESATALISAVARYFADKVGA